MKIKHVDHIGIVVDNLADAKEFFVDLGFKVMGEMPKQGELVERVTGLAHVQSDLIMLEAPDGQINLEIVKYNHPADPKGVQSHTANTLGLRHIAFQVEDLDGFIDVLKKKGRELVSEPQNYENMWKLVYVRGPEGIIVELAERL